MPSLCYPGGAGAGRGAGLSPSLGPSMSVSLALLKRACCSVGFTKKKLLKKWPCSSLLHVPAGFGLWTYCTDREQTVRADVDVVCHCGECRCRGGAAQALRTRAECAFFWWWVVLPAQQKIHSTVRIGVLRLSCLQPLDRKCTQQQATGVHRDVLMFLPRGTPDNRQPAKVRCEGVRSPARPRTQPPIHNNGAGCTIFVLMNSSLSCLLEGQYKGVHTLARHRSAYWRRCSDTS